MNKEETSRYVGSDWRNEGQIDEDSCDFLVEQRLAEQVEPDYLEELLNAAERENADVVGCNLIKEFANRSEPVKTPLPPNGKECVGRLLTGEIPGWLHIKLVKKEVIDSNPGTRWWVEGFDLWEDLLFCVQFFYYARKIVYVDKDLYHYRQGNSESLTLLFTSPLSDKRCANLIGIFSCIENFLTEKELLEEYTTEINERKIFVKTCIITFAPAPQAYFSLYPDLHKSVRVKNLKTLYHKTLFFLCDRHCYGAVNFILRLKRLATKK